MWTPPLFATLSGKVDAMGGGDLHDVETVIAQQLNQMSVQEREHVQEEIHGIHGWQHGTGSSSISTDHVSQHPDPSPHSHSQNDDGEDQTGDLLQWMQTAIDEIHKRANRTASSKASAYSVAVEHGFQYVHSVDFRIKFLRAEQDPACSAQTQRQVADRAALRYLLYLDLLYQFFGLEALRRPLSLAHDFTEEDLAFMKEGQMQIWPSRDRANRRIASIIVMSGQTYPPMETRVSDRGVGALRGIPCIIAACVCSCRPLTPASLVTEPPYPKPVGKQIRSYIYCWSVIANDELSQKRGYVGIVYFDPSMSVVFSQTMLAYRQIFDHLHASMPIRISAFHYIDGTQGSGLTAVDIAASRVFRNVLAGTWHQFMRVRCRFHMSGTYNSGGHHDDWPGITSTCAFAFRIYVMTANALGVSNNFCQFHPFD